MTAAAVPSQAAPDTPPAEDKIRAELAEEFEESTGKVDFWVRFAERPDLDSFAGIADWDARGRAVHEALTDAAAASQQRALATLEKEGVAHTAFWITNAIRVTGGTEELALTLAGDAQVEGVYPTRTYEAPEVEPVPLTEVGPAAVEWGVADINADDVWDQLGIRGEGIVVGNIDTGVQYDHPALVNQYRGANGDGTFSHDYNWFDASGQSPTEPADLEGHGSHVMGTMVGDDGGANQIGVAPGATWVAANGCCPSDAALITSGQWMLAPTRLDGSGADPGQRPHVINNSWGTVMPSNDPFMEDVSQAWAAAGQFGVWANGNIGPECETSGSPGSRIINYSVGNYDASHTIAPSSSRGAGQDGSIKPNISAPGTRVRSSVPGNGYAAYTGTSMAAPHVAGAIALMWASSPQLVGDVETTWELLNGSAVDTEDLQCGGTAENNNVFGEGRLDALALVSSAPRGDTGYLEGVVTDAATGEPIPAAQVSITGPVERSVRTNSEGAYRALVSAGDYEVTASRFSWITQSRTVTVPVDGTATADFALERAPIGTVSGTVTDGSGQGYPLYARVSVQGTDLFTFTDPEDGSYTLDVPLQTEVTLAVEVQYPGYQVVSEQVTLAGDTTWDAAVPVDAQSCTAYGYEGGMEGLTETFDGTTAPPGWTVVDNMGNGQVWRFDDPGGRGNLTGGEGGFAVVDSDYYPPDGQQDTSLVSPVIDLSGASNPTLTFRHFAIPTNPHDVDLSLDGGQTWTTVYSVTDFREGEQEQIPLPGAAGQSQVQVRFHYYDAFWTLWWQVDDVMVGDRLCEPVGEGGYVFGNVRSTVQDQPVRGARVVSLDNPADSGVTRDTPADAGQDDGFYWLFSHLAGSHPFEASARTYGSQVQDVTVPDGGSVRADFALQAGLLTVDPTSIETEVVLGASATEELTVTNEGDREVDVELREVRGDFVMQRADGSRAPSATGSRELQGAPVRTSDGTPSVVAFPGQGRTPGEAPARGPAEEPWVELTPAPEPVLDNRVVALDGQWYSIGGGDGSAATTAVYRYDNAAMAWTEVAPLPEPLNSSAAGAVDGRIVVSGGWSESGTPTAATYVYDPAADEWTRGADNPVAVSSAGQAVLEGQFYTVGGCTTDQCFPISAAASAYDVVTDTWTSVDDYPMAMAFPACGGVEGQVVCNGGVDDNQSGSAATFGLDPQTGSWSALADSPSGHWGSSSGAANGLLVVSGGVHDDITNETFGYDPLAESWVDLPNPEVPVYRGGAGCGFVKVGGDEGGFSPTDVVELLPGFDECGDAGVDVPWLSLDTYEATLAPGESVTVEVTTDGDVAQPGVYTAGIKVLGGMAGSEPTVPVTMTVTPPATWGKLMGQVDGESCEGDLTPLGGATVDAVPTRMSDPWWRMVTDAEGTYARWIDTRVGELEMIASHPAHRSEQALVTPRRGQITVRDFELLDARCEAPPTPIHPDVRRLEGKNKYGTAAVVAQQFEPGVDTVFLVTGENYPDALTSAARAGSLGGPVLLTRPGELPPSTAVELERLAPREVVVVGGTTVITDAVLRAAGEAADAPARRVAGKNRYITSARVAAEFRSADTVFVTTGEAFPDALAAAARAGAVDAPVLLVRPGSIPDSTAAQLRRLAPEQIWVLGGTDAVSTAVERALGEYGDVERVPGEDRYRTAAALAQAYPTAAHVYIASGQNWPDAVAGAALAARDEAPLLLVRRDGMPGATWAALERLEPGTITVFGGPEAVLEEVLDLMRTLE